MDSSLYHKKLTKLAQIHLSLLIHLCSTIRSLSSKKKKIISKYNISTYILRSKLNSPHWTNCFHIFSCAHKIKSKVIIACIHETTQITVYWPSISWVIHNISDDHKTLGNFYKVAPNRLSVLMLQQPRARLQDNANFIGHEDQQGRGLRLADLLGGKTTQRMRPEFCNGHNSLRTQWITWRYPPLSVGHTQWEEEFIKW